MSETVQLDGRARWDVDREFEVSDFRSPISGLRFPISAFRSQILDFKFKPPPSACGGLRSAGMAGRQVLGEELLELRGPRLAGLLLLIVGPALVVEVAHTSDTRVL